VKKSVKTSKDLLKGRLTALDEILDVCSSFFLSDVDKSCWVNHRHDCSFVKDHGNLLLCKKIPCLKNLQMVYFI